MNIESQPSYFFRHGVCFTNPSANLSLVRNCVAGGIHFNQGELHSAPQMLRSKISACLASHVASLAWLCFWFVRIFIVQVGFGRQSYFFIRLNPCFANMPLKPCFLVVVKVLSSCHNFVNLVGGIFFQAASLAFWVGGLTQRAADGWDSAAFSSIFYTRTESCPQGFISSRPHAGNASRWGAEPKSKYKTVFDSQVSFSISV